MSDSSRDVAYCELRSTYGHDAFLLEVAEQTDLVRGFLASTFRQVARCLIVGGMALRIFWAACPLGTVKLPSCGSGIYLDEAPHGSIH